MNPRLLVAALLFSVSTFSFAQTAQQKPETPAPPAKAGEAAAAASVANATPATPAVKPDRAAAYYHYSLGHIYEELVSSYARSEFANKAIEEYKLALQYDPDSPYLNASLYSSMALLANFTLRPGAFAMPFSKRSRSSAATLRISKPAVCSAAFICARSETCRPERNPRRC